MESDTSAAASLASYQHNQLCRAAEASGRVNDLLYYYAALRDGARLASLEARALGGHPEDELVCRLMRGGEALSEADALIALGREAKDPWAVCTLVKHWLSQGKVAEALALAVEKLSQGGYDVFTLNLIARYAHATGHASVASRVLERSLIKAPEQRDMVQLQAQIAAGVAATRMPSLELLPPRYRVAYYLPCYNVEAHIARTIEAVASQCHPIEELLIIDDATPDASVEIAQRYPVRVIRHPENRGLAAARNTAWQHAEAEFIATVDTDACPEPGYLKYALMEFEQGAPGLALVGGRLIEVYTDTPADAFRALYMKQDPGKARWYLGCDSQEDTVLETKPGPSSARVFVTGSDSVGRRSAMAAVEGYPERHRTNGEDSAFCLRLLAKGYHFAFAPYCEARHYRRDTVASVLRTSWQYGFWHRFDNGYYEGPEQVLELLDDYGVAGHYYITRSIEENRLELVYIAFLNVFFGTLLDMQHGVRIGLVTPGQALTVEQALVALVGELDMRFGGALLKKVRRDLEALSFSEKALPEALDGRAREVFDRHLAALRQDYQTYNAAFYQLLLQH